MKKSTPTFLFILILLLMQVACGGRTEKLPTSIATAVVQSPSQVIVQSTYTLTAQRPQQTQEPAQKESTPEQSSINVLEAENGQIARRHLEMLSETIGDREFDTPGEEKAAEYIQSVFDGLGYDTQSMPFEFTDEEEEETYSSANIIAVKRGLSDQEIIVGAHYDSDPTGDGADDNASGVAVLLEVAEMMVDITPPYTIRFITFGAEENDLDGSRAYVENMSRADIDKTISMINLDSMISGNTMYVYGDVGGIRDWIIDDAQEYGFELDAKTAEDLNDPDGSPCECTDFHAFQQEGIPYAYFEATDWTLGDEDGGTQVDEEYGENGVILHTSYDTIDYIDETFPGRIDEHLNTFVTLLYDALTEYKTEE